MPGLVDTHVHVNEPGRTDWEGFETATRAAAAGWRNDDCRYAFEFDSRDDHLAGFESKLAAARGKLSCRLLDSGAASCRATPASYPNFGNAGVVGFKCFLIHSGVDEFPNVAESDLREAMPELARLGAMLIVHAEVPGPVEAACCNADAGESSSSYETFLRSRPRAAENEAVNLMIRLSRETGCRVHVVHHSSADALPALRTGKEVRLAPYG